MAMNSKFVWLSSGPLHGVIRSEVTEHCHSIIETLQL